jgi:DNA-binding LytR/AlgR family response regulator
MAEIDLQGLRILVVEDEYLIADDLRDTLLDAAAVVLGPVPTVEAAKTVIEKEPAIDAALLDINLGGTLIFDVADDLAARGVPFAFATGYDQWSIPPRFCEVPRLEKPLRATQVAAAIGRLLEPHTS